MHLMVLYPTSAAPVATRFGPYSLEVARDAVPLPGGWPVVVISHGSGGSHLTHRGLAQHLVRAGFVVLLAEHPGNNRRDNGLAGTAAILEQRPRDLGVALDWLASSSGEVGGAADLRRIGLVGHSLGGFTALALAGGKPTSFAHETTDGMARAVPVTADERVAAVVLLAPATPWFMAEGSLHAIEAPVLMYTASEDRLTPPLHGNLIVERLAGRDRLDHRVVEGAGHYAFLAPFPVEMSDPGFAPAEDPPGFDRVAFHARLYPDVTAFLDRHLRPVG